jgi:mono/diheme cytochrome c family protein
LRVLGLTAAPGFPIHFARVCLKLPNQLLQPRVADAQLGFALIGFVFASTDATAQRAPKTQEQLEQVERLIYSVKGPDLFRAHCAACHGEDAKGSGPMASALKAKVPDLTVLAKNNGGQFPSARVRKIVAGDDVLASHGSREMPIWGPIFHQIESDQDWGNVRVENLVKYLQSIQQK